ncbi:MAG: hypothetical protein ACPL1Y_06335, partial [Thermoplasmata archaeon]
TPDQIIIEKEFRIWVVVKDIDLDYDSVYVNLSSVDSVRFPVPIKMKHTIGWKFETENLILSDNMEPGRFIVKVWAVDIKG